MGVTDAGIVMVALLVAITRGPFGVKVSVRDQTWVTRSASECSLCSKST